ncbi:MAG: type I DNA topoisomerase [Pseudobdellovibrionaceae bacterium]|jgi:DNA topoisomerase-1|nr:type I DNA topoisomerase [Pseudobdellovibrionaceae bacterium]
MSASNVVIVESPAKAKTINKYLGKDYYVLASFGHVRDLVAKDGAVNPDDDFDMRWELSDRADKTIRDISAAVKSADTVYLCTDPDREGEAISWHIQQILEDKKLLTGKELKRVTFNEITKNAIKAAFEKPRTLDKPLIDAYLARRALDFLVGFTLSPVLWRKLPGSKSAGRVQSVALRLICEREAEIEAFNAQEYWSIHARMQTEDGATFMARLTHLAGNKLDKLDIGSQADAEAAVKRILNKKLSVQKVEKKQVRRNPYAPFITSSLQMEASRKLRFSASQTMRLAQQLYEGVDIGGETVGLITYMRTDGITLSDDAISQCRAQISSHYGQRYLPDSPRIYKSKAKNAQEAHEAIRPTDLSRRPEEMRRYLDDRQAALYELIWKRTLASQMESAVLDQVAADLSDGTDDVVLRATGSVVTFDGFLTLYKEDDDEDSNTDPENEDNRLLPPLSEGMGLRTQDVTPEQHFTQPPPRYSEASLVKKLEEMGIGRPSTYASIIQVLQDRSYVTLDKRRFVPEDRGRLVTTFLKKFFEKYVDYDFTANLEDELDAISSGQVMWKEALRQFWAGFKTAVDGTKDLTITMVLDELDAELGPHFFPISAENPDPRKCPACENGRLSLKVGKYGAFIGCSNYPDCKHTRPLVVQSGEALDDANSGAALGNEPKVLGNDPGTGRTITLRKGPYGPYVQIDVPEDSVDKKEKPKRQGVPRNLPLEQVTLEAALKLLALPRLVGHHPETGEKIEAGIGRFGPYIKYQSRFKSIPKDEDVLTIGMNRAVELCAQIGEKKVRPVKKASEKKTTAKKPAAKKTAAKKPSAKKTVEKKTVAKKTTTVKKSTPKKTTKKAAE